jgi:hypothetical protein
MTRKGGSPLQLALQIAVASVATLGCGGTVRIIGKAMVTTFTGIRHSMNTRHPSRWTTANGQRLIRNALALATSLTLASCGGGGGGSNGPNFPPLGTAVTRENVKVIPDTATITPVDDNTLTITDGAADPVVGDVLVSGEGQGLLVKVTAVRPISGGFEVDTEPAGLHEVFEEANFAFEEVGDFTGIVPESDLEGVTIDVQTRGRGRANDVLVFGFDGVNLAFRDAQNRQVRIVLDGDLEFDTKTIASGSINASGDVLAVVGAEDTVKATLTARGSYKGEFTSPDIPIGRPIEMQPIRFQVGQIPVIITRKLSFIANFKITAEIGSEYKITATLRTETLNLVQGNANTGLTQTLHRQVTTDADHELKLTGYFNGALEMNFLRADAEFLLYGLAGPRFKISVGNFRIVLRAAIDATPDDGAVPGDVTVTPEYNPKIDADLRLASIFGGSPTGELRLAEGIFPLSNPFVIAGGDIDVGID